MEDIPLCFKSQNTINWFIPSKHNNIRYIYICIYICIYIYIYVCVVLWWNKSVDCILGILLLTIFTIIPLVKTHVLYWINCEGEASTPVYFSIMLCDFYLIMAKTAETCSRVQMNACSVLMVVFALTISTDIDFKSLLQDKLDDFLLFSWHT
jgi:hypothetical protein